jgi:DNA processing protein
MTYNSRLLITLMALPKIGATTAKKILEGLSFKVSSPNDFIDVVEDSIQKTKTPSFTKSEVEQAISHANKVEEMSERSGIKITSIFDSNYPEKLKRLKKPPVILNYIGDFSILKDKKNCAVIGTRNPTEHGYKYGVRISKKMAELDFVVVSGLAIGCDTAGHKGCLEGNGKTVAVLAQGLNVDKIYPKENRGLAKEIIDSGGLLFSEYTIDQTANQNFFIERDRIQAGLSDFLFVVETGLKGGTWHTINFAIESKVPVATYNHPEKYKQFEQTLGNQKLIIENKARGIYSLDDLNVFLSTVYKDDVNSIDNISINNDFPIETIVITSQTIDHSLEEIPTNQIEEPKIENEEPILEESKPDEEKPTKKKGKDSSQQSLF